MKCAFKVISIILYCFTSVGIYVADEFHANMLIMLINYNSFSL